MPSHSLHDCNFYDLYFTSDLGMNNKTLPTPGAPCPFLFLLTALEVHLAFIEGSCEESAGRGARKVGLSPRYDSN
jgi:hypothetical protein